MTTYTAITAGEKDPESPVDVNLIGKLDDNPHAMFEGATGAPRVQTAALEQAAGLEAVTNSAIRSDELYLSTKANKSIESNGSQSINATSYWVPAVGFYNVTAGTLIQFQIYAGGAWNNSVVGSIGGLIWCDGTNMRFYNTDGTTAYPVAWQKMN